MKTALLLFTFYASQLFAADSIRHDPFRKPLIEALPAVLAVEKSADEAPAAVPGLRGILRSPRETLVNLDGKLVALGERFEHFVVISVGERNAVLQDGESTVVVSIDDEPRPSDASSY